jgi:hypothetical protein
MKDVNSNVEWSNEFKFVPKTNTLVFSKIKPAKLEIPNEFFMINGILHEIRHKHQFEVFNTAGDTDIHKMLKYNFSLNNLLIPRLAKNPVLTDIICGYKSLYTEQDSSEFAFDNTKNKHPNYRNVSLDPHILSI